MIREAIMNVNLDAVDTIMKLVKASKLTTLSQSSEYSKLSLFDLEEVALQNGVNISELHKKYPDSRIYRMRLVMLLKKTVQ